MKSIIILISIIILSACTKDNAKLIQIPNGDFESWTNLLPNNWVTNSCPYCLPAFETYIIQQDTPAYEGKYAAKFIYNNVYAATAENKFALSEHPDYLTANVKCNHFGNDTVSVKIKLLKNSIAVDSGQWLGTSTMINYIQIKIPISQTTTQVDSAVINIKGGNKIGLPANNTELWIDNLELK